LKSGGYIVINPTEALVSIDVNSGRATKGRHIEETALKTNLEAAEEIARQLRLRDQGGLIVIDFIDMEDNRSNRTVERKLRDSMQNDRARIRLGRISTFGLLELSRQRLHPSLVETNFETCKHCTGVGLVRTIETTGVIVLRAIEEEGLRARASEIKVSVPTEIALYIFNKKREMLASIEKRYNLRVMLHADDTLIKPNYVIDIVRIAGAANDRPAERSSLAPAQSVDMSDMPLLDETETADVVEAADEFSPEAETGGHRREGRRPRRQARGGGRDRQMDRQAGQEHQQGDNAHSPQNPSEGGGGQNGAPSHERHGERVLEHVGGPSSSGEEGGNQRKGGWWKRLTE